MSKYQNYMESLIKAELNVKEVVFIHSDDFDKFALYSV